MSVGDVSVKKKGCFVSPVFFAFLLRDKTLPYYNLRNSQGVRGRAVAGEGLTIINSPFCLVMIDTKWLFWRKRMWDIVYLRKWFSAGVHMYD